MRKQLIAGALALGLALAGCSSPGGSGGAESSAPAAQGGFPAKVQSCDETLEFEKAPERILVLSEVDFSILYDLGLADRVVAKAGTRRIDDEFPEMSKILDEIPTLEAGDTGTGGAKVSTEAALSVNPDVVFGYDRGADREKLRASGVPLYSPDESCPNWTTDHASYDIVYREIDKIATMFGVQDKAEEVKDKVKKRLEDVEKNAPSDSKGTAAGLFVVPGSAKFYTYGTSSMVQPIFEANGLKNVYDDSNKRVFDASMESLLEEDPEWIVLMSDSMTLEEAKAILKGLPGADGLQAVKNDKVVYLPSILTGPTTLAVDGAVKLSELLKK